MDMGEISDGYHTFNELYHHRAVLFSVICNANKEIAWKSKAHADGTMFDGMFIVGINTRKDNILTITTCRIGICLMSPKCLMHPNGTGINRVI